MSWRLLGGPVVKNLPTSAGETGSVPDLGRSHRPGRSLSLCSTIEPMAQEPGSCNSRRTCTRGPLLRFATRSHHMRSLWIATREYPLLSITREKATQQCRSNTAKKKKKEWYVLRLNGLIWCWDIYPDRTFEHQGQTILNFYRIMGTIKEIEVLRQN